jgi:hypothetical protein
VQILNWLLLFALTALAGLGALALALRMEVPGRAERALAFCLLFWTLIVAPIFILGYGGWLYRAPVALLSFAVSSGVLGMCARGRAVSDFASELTGAIRALFRLLSDAVKICGRARSFAALGVLAVGCMLAFTLFLTYLVPADESWDGLYYHQPIVGFAIQSHGFGLVDLPNTLLAQPINGYPKLGEAFSLWFVLFTDKTLIELGSSLAAPGLMLGIYALARRYTTDRAACMGWSAVVLLMPVLSSQFRTTMIDVELWTFVLAAAYFATRPEFRPRDAGLALLGCALALGTKSTGLALTPVVVVVVLVRSLRGQRRSFAPWVAAGLVSVAAILLFTFGRNFRAFHNPFWPVRFSSSTLGVDFPGVATLAQVAPDLPFREFLSRAYEHPAGGVHDIIVRGYGLAIPWVVVPFGALALLVCAVVVGRGFARGARDRTSENLALVALVLLLPLCATPSLSNARYNVQAVVAAALGIIWAGERWSLERFQEGALASSVVLSLTSFVWSGYLWGLGLTFADIGALVHHSKLERAALNFSTFQMPANVAALREAELGPGDVAVFTRDLTFIGVLWNDQFSNRVVYLPPQAAGASLLAELQSRHARWVAVGEKTAARRTLERSSEYEIVGTAAAQDRTVVFRRRRGGRD